MQANLKKLIGKKFNFRNRTWLLVEVLEVEEALVIAPLEAAEQQRIQTDQYGQASRRCRECITLHLNNPEDTGYSETILELLSGHLDD